MSLDHDQRLKVYHNYTHYYRNDGCPLKLLGGWFKLIALGGSTAYTVSAYLMHNNDNYSQLS